MVLVRPGNSTGVSGDQEAHLLDDIARAENPHRDEMHRIAANLMSYITQCSQPDFAAVMEPLEAYMQLAGAICQPARRIVQRLKRCHRCRRSVSGGPSRSWTEQLGPHRLRIQSRRSISNNIVEQLSKLPRSVHPHHRQARSARSPVAHRDGLKLLPSHGTIFSPTQRNGLLTDLSYNKAPGSEKANP